MTSQGQRFRRRALRRGYKVDEVDSFLDRVEATLAGDPLGAPVSAQEVHDVVFRVRFGGYDEWQVDLHLDRVERQLAELEERGGIGRGGDRGMDRMGPPDRLGPPERMPMRDDRMAPPLPPRPVSPMPAAMGPQDPYGRYEEPGYGAYDDPRGYERPGPYDAFEPGRHGKMDMTAEIRMPDRDSLLGPGPGMGGPPMPGMPPSGGPPMPGMPAGAPPMAGMPAPGGGVPAGDLHRIDMLRRTFQPRRFGSGYDPLQVDQLFEGIITAMAGRGPMPISEAELETARFGLVPGGYFEAEVDAALKEVRDILRRH